MFTQFNRQGHRTLCEEISRELTALGQRLGVTFSVAGGNIGTTDLTMKVVATSADPQVAERNARRELDVYGGYYGLKGDDYGAVFTVQGKRFKLTGVSPSRPKFPLDGECLRTGKSFKFTESVKAQIIAQRGATPAAPAPLPPAATGPSYNLPPAFVAPSGLPQF